MKDEQQRYDVFGWDYELFNTLTEPEIAWYSEAAARADGPVLELACGSGRLVAALAARGFSVDGVDLSETMLDLARKRIGALPEEARSRARFFRGDMTAFQLDRTYGLAIIADNSFRNCSTRKTQLACLACVARHLRPGGELLVTERRFNPAWFANGPRVADWSQPTRHPVTGDVVTRRVETRLSEDGKWIHGEMTYRTTRPDGHVTTEQFPIDAPVMRVPDYVALFAGAGFTTRVCVGYKDQADDGKDPILCFVCKRNPS